MKPQTLLNPTTLNGLTLSNRMAMAPMTRSRADEHGVPTASMVEYYAQRAGAGLIITEATNISESAIGSPFTPGLYTEEHISGWRQVTDAVHAKGGKIVAQLWHTGRVAHSVERNGAQPVAPSAIAIKGQQHFTRQGMMDYEVPRALEPDEIGQIVSDYRLAARNAAEAGFDGVELHAAFGYLPNQFLVDGSNRRTDAYGGSIENRVRFVLEVMDAMIEEVGAGRVGIKLSPSIPFNGMIDSDPHTLYSHLIEKLNERRPAYVHLMQALFPLDDLPHWPTDPLTAFGPMIESPVIANGGFDAESAEAVLNAGKADVVSFGTLFVANPDLPRRFELGAPLAEADRDTLYGGGDQGYIDYPKLGD